MIGVCNKFINPYLYYLGSESEQRLDLDVIEANTSLLGDILKLGETSERDNVEVIMLIGTTGSGKSAMINTIHTVLTGKSYQIARMGSGNATSVTLDLTRSVIYVIMFCSVL